ncbi:MAG TPA: glycosyltransferase [Xanthobacteraceae bacterium]|jgi:exo-beta-1,3-glucanase (GH17 family)/cellulose synthase/poly-beta-1,6-N-acetylglucosamine synthase-like glycosyltransferase|nr:glycosyltransferase [Xanthobacteraceae bacterium]
MRTVVAVLALVACVHAGMWALLRPQLTAPDYNGQLASVSYTPFAKVSHPDSGERPTVEQIRADLKAIAPYTRAIRLYSSTGGAEMVPPIAAEFGLKVTLGIWLDKHKDRNEREIRAALDLVRHNGNINAIVVGNETLLRQDMSAADLIKVIQQQVKRYSPVPVTTAENWDVWLAHPELASSVDFITVHILPYWGGTNADQAVDSAIQTYDRLRKTFPGKRIVIGEFGWPSAGYNFQDAVPGRLDQAQLLRDFVSRAEAYGISYNVIEAIDQPWKTMEGGVGAYWGLFDASHDPKFSWTGPIVDPDYLKQALLAVALGFLLSLPILAIAGVTFPQALMLATSANVVGAWLTSIVVFWKGHYFVVGAGIALSLGVLLLLPLIAIALSRLDEIAAIAFGRGPRRLAISPPLVPDGYTPKVSIHIPACREAPHVLCATLDAVARLDYANFECVLVINNTPDPALWRPVEEHCQALGERFKFVRVDNLSGYKAGALRLALTHTAPDAEIIASIDADYVVAPDWLKDMAPLFADPRVGFVQAPQDHRDGERSVMHYAMNAEYAGFFDIGMVQRNEVNAIIMHGTMCLIRRSALESVGNWSSDTIVEDSDLGLALLENGWLAHYSNKRYGHGLLPDTYESFKKQRHRWAFGGLQLVRKHWRRMLPGVEGLLSEQKREFGVGWLNWLGAETLGVAVVLLNLVWVPLVILGNIKLPDWVINDPVLLGIASFGAVPDRILTVPIIASFLVTFMHFAMLYRLRVRATPGQMAGAVVAAMSVQWTVASAVATGVIKERLPFLRTDKGGVARKGPDFPAFWEAVIGALLISGAVALVATNYKQVREINLFAAVLVVQSLPFLSAVALAVIEGTTVNSFVFWHGLEARLSARVAALLPRSKAVITEAIAVEQAKLPAADKVEAAQ